MSVVYTKVMDFLPRQCSFSGCRIAQLPAIPVQRACEERCFLEVLWLCYCEEPFVAHVTN